MPGQCGSQARIWTLRSICCGTIVTLFVAVAVAKSPDREKSTAKAAQQQGHTRTGLASYYGKGLQGKKTADGEKFDKNELTAAHPTYPLGTRLRVTNLRNGRAVNVRVNDRGPSGKHRARGVIVDLSEGAANELGFRRQGLTRVKTEVIELGEGKGAAPAPSRPHARPAGAPAH